MYEYNILLFVLTPAGESNRFDEISSEDKGINPLDKLFEEV